MGTSTEVPPNGLNGVIESKSSAEDQRLRADIGGSGKASLGLTKIGWGPPQTQPGDRSSCEGDPPLDPRPGSPAGVAARRE